MRSKKLITYQERGEVYPKGYTEEDIKFLKKQREDIVRREDLDEIGKKIYDSRNKIGPRKEDGSFSKGGSVIDGKRLRGTRSYKR